MITQRTVLNEWQKVWLVYVGRTIGLIAPENSERIAIVKQLLVEARNDLLHAEAALCLASAHEISFDALDTALRTRPEPLVYWYALAIRELKGNVGGEIPGRISAVASTSPLYKILIDG
jgi:hypothetical protein